MIRPIRDNFTVIPVMALVNGVFLKGKLLYDDESIDLIILQIEDTEFEFQLAAVRVTCAETDRDSFLELESDAGTVTVSTATVLLMLACIDCRQAQSDRQIIAALEDDI
jgi:hypothetical protein